MAAHAGLQGADTSMLRQIRECATTDAMLELLTEWKLREKVMESLFRSIGLHVSKRTGDGVVCGTVIFSEQYGYLGQTSEAGDILGRQKEQRRGQEW
jgi:cobalt-precorrin-5B (C1)-methyltransferase